MGASDSWWQDFNVIGLAYDGVGVLALWVLSLHRLGETLKAEGGTNRGYNGNLLQSGVRARIFNAIARCTSL